jgi:hypothetical protein
MAKETRVTCDCCLVAQAEPVTLEWPIHTSSLTRGVEKISAHLSLVVEGHERNQGGESTVPFKRPADLCRMCREELLGVVIKKIQSGPRS